MSAGRFNAGSNPGMSEHPIQERREILQKCYRNPRKALT